MARRVEQDLRIAFKIQKVVVTQKNLYSRLANKVEASITSSTKKVYLLQRRLFRNLQLILTLSHKVILVDNVIVKQTNFLLTLTSSPTDL